jgi:hypothetical protein
MQHPIEVVGSCTPGGQTTLAPKHPASPTGVVAPEAHNADPDVEQDPGGGQAFGQPQREPRQQHTRRRQSHAEPHIALGRLSRVMPDEHPAHPGLPAGSRRTSDSKRPSATTAATASIQHGEYHRIARSAAAHPSPPTITQEGQWVVFFYYWNERGAANCVGGFMQLRLTPPVGHLKHKT